MATSKQTPPKLAVSIPMAKANATSARLDALVPNLASDLSPSLVYEPGADNEVVKNGAILTANDYAWTAPDLNNGQPYTVQVECIGAAGGGGGGAATGVGGGGGGGGGEYACEPVYPVVPGETYSYFAGFGGKGGKTSPLFNGVPAFPGSNGQPTAFDLRGKGITGGVIANGGFGGDQNGQGLGGVGGTGSVNTIHFDGGLGGTSSSGIMSDNPNTGIGLSRTLGWWRLDDAVGQIVAQDYGPSRVAVSHGQYAGAVVQPRAVAAPPQVPFGASQNWWGGSNPTETQGNCWLWDHGTSSGNIGGLLTGFHTPQLGGLTVSAWIKGGPSAAHYGDWSDGTHGSAIIASSMDASRPTTSKGWCFYLFDANGSTTLNFEANNSAGTFFSTSANVGPSAIDGNWHMVTLTWAPGTNNVIFYVDGVLSAQATGSISTIAASAQPVSIGYNVLTGGYGFKGYMSNMYVSSGVASSAFIAIAYGSTPAAGGSGGGASGGSAGVGNPGVLAASTTGGAGGASAVASELGITTGSGAGGTGGNSGFNGSAAPAVAPYGGGGGGAGAYAFSVPSAFTIEVPCSMSASYAGLDASGAAAGQLYTVSADPGANETDPWYNTAAKQDAICYSGGAGAAPFKGSMNTLLTFPSLATIDGNAGPVTDYLASGDWTVQNTFLKLTVASPNASIIVIGAWLSNAIIPTVDSDATLTAWGYGSAALTAYIPAGVAGRQVLIDLTGTNLMTSMMLHAYSNGFSQDGHALQGVGLLIGALQGSSTFAGNVNGAWNSDEAEDWYTAFHGSDTDPTLSAALEIHYTASSTTTISAGDGADGYIVIRFIDPKGTPVATMLPEAATDDKGNALGAGFTADPANYHVWQPGSSPRTLETWHPVSSLSNGWVMQGASNCGYRLLPGNLLMIKLAVNGGSATTDTVFTLPSGWRPANQQYAAVASNGQITFGCYIQIGADGTVNVSGGHGHAQIFLCNAIIALDEPS